MKFEAKADTTRFGRAIEKLLAAGADLTPLMEDVGLLALSEFKRGFDTGGFGKWPPLKRATQLYKEHRFPGAPIMVRTGSLRESIIERDAQDNIFEVGPHGVNVGTAVPYAYKQHDGEGNLPGRPIVFVTPGLENGAADLAESYVEKLVQ